jgi:hypothetical protein
VLDVVSADFDVAHIRGTNAAHDARIRLFDASDTGGMMIFKRAAAGGLRMAEDGVPLTFETRVGASTFERLRIEGDGNVGIGTATPGGLLHVNGMVRMGVETGTSEPPNTQFAYTGMVIRRITSTDSTAGQILARGETLRLERDGTNDGLRLAWDAGGNPDQVAYGTALRNNGVLVPIVINVGAPAVAGSTPLFTDTDVVRLDVAIGTVFNTRDVTEITLIRRNGDFWWVGSITSSFDQ